MKPVKYTALLNMMARTSPKLWSKEVRMKIAEKHHKEMLHIIALFYSQNPKNRPAVSLIVKVTITF